MKRKFGKEIKKKQNIMSMIVVKWQINTLSETGNAKNVVKLALNARYQVES